MTEQISNEQVQELTDAIADKCQEMGLEPEQILEGIGRAIISAATVFGMQEVEIEVDGVGSCQVTTQEQ